MKIVLLVLFCSNIVAQEFHTDTITSVGSKNELSYEFLIAPGYSHIFQINNSFKLGVGLHMGFAFDPIFGYSDFFMIKLFTRDIFRSRKSSFKPEKMDLGFISSISFQNESVFYGILVSYYINFNKRWKLGLNGQFGEFITNDSRPFGIYITPGIYYKILTR